MPDKPARRVYVCAGGDCREHKNAWKKLHAAVGEHVPVHTVKCQKICKGPVVGVKAHDKTLSWFRKVRGSELREELVDLITTGNLRPGLRERRSPKRKGKLRK